MDLLGSLVHNLDGARLVSSPGHVHERATCRDLEKVPPFLFKLLMDNVSNRHGVDISLAPNTKVRKRATLALDRLLPPRARHSRRDLESAKASRISSWVAAAKGHRWAAALQGGPAGHTVYGPLAGRGYAMTIRRRVPSREPSGVRTRAGVLFRSVPHRCSTARAMLVWNSEQK